jgi:predicted phage baseplate assembly protein
MPHPEHCGCCEGVSARTPLEVYNRPGLSAIAYRIGTHARFKRSMLARLSEHPALRDLNTRDDDDFAISLLDAWATVADVLTFYGERVANENYLRTATERVSLLNLARLIGYEPRPGVAASVHLAFDLEDAPGAPAAVAIEKGAKVQSLPGPGEIPQTFETVKPVEARPEWNTLRPRMGKRVEPGMGDTALFLEGVTTGLSPGDALLLVGREREADPGSENWDLRLVQTVREDPAAEHTRVTWDRRLGWRRFGRVVRPAEKPAVFAFRRRAALFGHNAPDWRAMPESVRRGYRGGASDTQWPNFLIPSDDTVDLDALYPRVVPGSWLALSVPEYQEVYEVESVEEVGRADFTLTARVTRARLRGENLDRFRERLRDTRVFLEPEELEIAETPITDPVAGRSVTLDRRVGDDLPARRALILTGEDLASGEQTGEVIDLRGSEPDEHLTRLVFDRELAHAYRRDSVAIKANVARATHGETRQEVLGSGDAATPFQGFALREAPLTHTAAPVSGGTESSLEVRVDDVEWHGVPALYGRGPDERVFVTRTDEEGGTTVRFGSGETGARLPTGQDNVRAIYRKGIGLDGMARAGQLSLLVAQPLGLRGVTNPLAASGAANPEPSGEVRRNAPLTVLTLDRAVSLRDYEDFARAHAGVAKALAAEHKAGETSGVLLTVAGPGGRRVGEPLRENLFDALRRAGDPLVPLRVEEHREALFVVSARVEGEADRLPERVLATVEESLRERFGFEVRSFGQSVELSEVVAAIQNVPGVVAVDVDELYREDEERALRPRLEAAVPSADAAELLVLGALELGVMQ